MSELDYSYFIIFDLHYTALYLHNNIVPYLHV